MSSELREVVAQALEALRHAGAEAGDALLVESDAVEARVRGEEIDFVKQSREHTLGLRALVSGASGLRSASTSTSDLSAPAVRKMAEETVALARATAEDPHAGLPAEEAADDAPELGLFDPADREVDVEELVDGARRAEAAARATDPRIDNSEGSTASAQHHQIVYGNTQGFLDGYQKASHALFVEPLASQDGAMQRDYWFTMACRRAELDAPEDVGRRAAERALRRLGARRVPTCEASVVFDDVTAPSLLRHLASCVSGYAIYRQASYLADREGEVIGSELLHIVDDGRLPGRLGSRPFDAEGLPTRRNVLVEAGRLGGWLLDSYSARKLGRRSTGSASRVAGSPPTVSTSNLWLEPGSGSLDDLIASTPRGLLVTELIGQGFNPVTGDYSRGAAGLWIEDGRIQHPVEEVTIAGTLEGILGGIDAVGGELAWRGSVAAPPLRVGRMTIAGE